MLRSVARVARSGQLHALRFYEKRRGKRFLDDYYKVLIGLTRFDRRITCLNRGYAHLHDDGAYVDADEKLQLELYRQVVLTAGVERLAGANVLEISSGLGGGLDFVARTFGPRLCLGVEKALPAVISARRRFDLPFVEGDALDLRLPDGAFDVVLNIESSNAYFQPAFISEVARVLRPGGRFAFADHRPFTASHTEALMRERFEPKGLRLMTFRDVSANVARSNELDDARREDILRRLPAPARGFMRPMFNGISTENHRRLKAGAVTFFIAVFAKEGQRDR